MSFRFHKKKFISCFHNFVLECTLSGQGLHLMMRRAFSPGISCICPSRNLVHTYISFNNGLQELYCCKYFIFLYNGNELMKAETVAVPYWIYEVEIWINCWLELTFQFADLIDIYLLSCSKKEKVSKLLVITYIKKLIEF